MRPGAGAFALRGFWAGGFEGADNVNRFGDALDMSHASGHEARLDEDHRRAAQAGLSCIRESIGWRLCEDARGRIDLRRVQRIAASARRHRLQVLWTLMHYGTPDGLHIGDAAFGERFARFAGAVARLLRDDAEAPIYTPINEMSYLAWLCADTAALGSQVSGHAVKCRLVAATLAGIRAMRYEDPRARFMLVDPLVHVVPPAGRPELAERAAEITQWQWQAWDMVVGRAEPQLGGAPAALDIVGVNHYHTSQWELLSERRLVWHRRDQRRAPFDTLLESAWQRYRRPLFVAETSHVGVGRAAWLADIAQHTLAARARGVDIRGLCLYPLMDRPDWDAPARWHRSGVWHVPATALPGAQQRIVEPAVRGALARWQRFVASAPPVRGTILVLAARRWDTWPAREQPVVEALAGRWRILYVEPPEAHDGPARLDCRAVDPWIDVAVPLLSPHAGLGPLLQSWLRAQPPASVIAWTPGADAHRALVRALGLPLMPIGGLPGVALQAFAHASNAPGGGWAGEEARALLGDAAAPGAPLLCLGDGGREQSLWVSRLAARLHPLRVVYVVPGPDAPAGECAAPARCLAAPPLPLMPALLVSAAAVACLDIRRDSEILHALASGRPVLAQAGDRPEPCAQGWAAALRAVVAETPAQAASRRRRQAAFLRRHQAQRRAQQLDAMLERLLTGSGSRTATVPV